MQIFLLIKYSQGPLFYYNTINDKYKYPTAETMEKE